VDAPRIHADTHGDEGYGDDDLAVKERKAHRANHFMLSALGDGTEGKLLAKTSGVGLGQKPYHAAHFFIA